MASKETRTPIRSRKLTYIPFENHDEWLRIRKGYIGGSDAGAIIGLNPYSSPFSVWAEKTGRLPEFEGNVTTKVGSFLEDLVARMFMEETGKKVQRFNFTIVNPEYPWACANIDREVLGEDAVLEIKTTNSFVNVKKFRTGEYPEQWYTQMTHYMAVTGAQKCYLAVLSECRDFRIFELSRDEEEIKALMEAEENFWNKYVKTNTMPPIDGSAPTTTAIKELFPFAGEGTADLSSFADALQQRKILKDQIKALNEQIDTIDNQIKAAMGTAESGSAPGFSITWKDQASSALDRDLMKMDYPGIDFTRYNKRSRVFKVTVNKQKSN